jgi:hypothetical protein
MSIHQRDPDAAPDSDYEPGDLRHLVVGNRGRMLDWRRTPVSISGLQPEPGFVVLRVDAFEDAGATWRIPFEDVEHFQFARGSAVADTADVERFRRTIDRLAVALVIEPAVDRLDESEAMIATAQAAADDRLRAHSGFLASGRPLPPFDERRSDPLLLSDTEAYMADIGLGDIEVALTRAYVSNPYAGELVKGHAIVLAEHGLAGFSGTIVRDPMTFEGAWSRDRRFRHIAARLGLVRALFRRLDLGSVLLWRGLAASDDIEIEHPRTFTSTSFSRAVAQSLADAGDERATSLVACRSVPAERVFMSYLETRAMNEQYLEAEAVLLASPTDGWV